MVGKAIFTDLLASFPFDVIVETGTWTGDTTGFMAATSRLPVFSGESNYQFHALAGLRLVDLPGITLRHADSRKFLSDLAQVPAMSQSNTFFYLDAHWFADLSLAGELDVNVSHWTAFVVMVDDYQVAGDEGYGYDDYRPGKALTLEYIATGMAHRGLRMTASRVRRSPKTTSLPSSVYPISRLSAPAGGRARWTTCNTYTRTMLRTRSSLRSRNRVPLSAKHSMSRRVSR